jgi:hypothetical protein
MSARGTPTSGPAPGPELLIPSLPHAFSGEGDEIRGRATGIAHPSPADGPAVPANDSTAPAEACSTTDTVSPDGVQLSASEIFSGNDATGAHGPSSSSFQGESMRQDLLRDGQRAPHPLAKAAAKNIMPLAVILKRIARTFHTHARQQLEQGGVDGSHHRPGTFVVLHIPGDGHAGHGSNQHVAVAPLTHAGTSTAVRVLLFAA